MPRQVRHASTSSGVDMATGRLGVEAPDSSDDLTGSPDADTSGSSTDEVNDESRSDEN